MRVEQTITFIVSRNFGHPITWNVQAWRVYAGVAAAAVLLAAMTLLSVLYLFTSPLVERLERERDDLRLERDALLDELRSANQEAFETKQAAWAQTGSGPKSPTPRKRAPTSLYSQEWYIPPLRIDSFSARAQRRSIEARFRIVRQGDRNRNRGGFIFAIFEDRTALPTRYATSPHVDVNEDGFPMLYKTGIRFSRVRNAQTYRRSVRIRAGDNPFTHVTVYLFSLRGGLLVKERFALDPALFTALL